MSSKEKRVAIGGDLDIVTARVEGRAMAKDLGFGVIDQARIATAISELARNVLLYAGNGSVTLSQIDDADRLGIEIRCEDRGQGIQEIEPMMQDGQGAARESGLVGTRRLMDEFEIKSQLGTGTTVIARKWLS
jgi:serine/threonine-protein kinase RsbT